MALDFGHLTPPAEGLPADVLDGPYDALSAVAEKPATGCGGMTDRSIVRIAPLRKPQGCGAPNFKIALAVP